MNKHFAQKLKIGKFIVAENAPAFIIAEIGSNHDRSLVQAKKLVDAAKAAGANAVKFQSLAFDKQWLASMASKSLKDLHKRVDFPDKEMKSVAAYAKKKGIIFFSAPTYMEAVDFLEGLNVPVHKIASPITVGFTALATRISETGKPIILSTGYCSKAEIDRAVMAVRRGGNNKMVMLYCISSYPTEAKHIDFAFMEKLQKEYGCLIGFSDHTMSTSLAALAVSKGARVIEKHLTLSRKLKGPDHPFAIEPHEFKEMVKNIRDAEIAIVPRKSEWRALRPFEVSFKKKVLMKLVSAKAMPKGTKLSKSDLIFRRAPGGIPEYEIDRVIGKTLKHSLYEHALITKKDLK